MSTGTKLPTSPWIRVSVVVVFWILSFVGHSVVTGRELQPSAIPLMSAMFVAGGGAVLCIQALLRKRWGWIEHFISVPIAAFIMAVFMTLLLRK